MNLVDIALRDLVVPRCCKNDTTCLFKHLRVALSFAGCCYSQAGIETAPAHHCAPASPLPETAPAGHALPLVTRLPLGSAAFGWSCSRLPTALQTKSRQSYTAPWLSRPTCQASGIPVLCVDTCLLYTSDAADEEDSVDLGGRRIIKKKKKQQKNKKIKVTKVNKINGNIH
eukprot:TRINITY_DN56214_c0_g1_i2.p1 TRINITY_DN56214_c0_g1~~TRINITY_DN56214_c0_g1_i2.p1  ORF type:complete len:171 (+),score=11.17 TRINITY_DN56214_c0_g1_i2:593-1105(+)